MMQLMSLGAICADAKSQLGILAATQTVDTYIIRWHNSLLPMIL